MEVAVSTVLAEISQLTAWDAFEDCRFWTDFKPSRRTVPQAAGVPHSSRNLWQPQVAISNSFSPFAGDLPEVPVPQQEGHHAHDAQHHHHRENPGNRIVGERQFNVHAIESGDNRWDRQNQRPNR